MHVCTDEDFAKFYPVDDRSRGQLERIKSEEKRNFLCLDWKAAAIELYGPESGGTYGELDLALLPCNTRLIPHGARDDRISPQCVANLDKQIEYIGATNLIVYYNQATFVEDDFSEARIDRHSTIRNIQVDQYRPNFVFGKIQASKLVDSIDLVQYG